MTRRTAFIGFAAGLAAALAGLGCAPSGAGNAAGDGDSAKAEQPEIPYKITATVGMVTDVVRRIAGERAEVTGIIGEGVDPHLYTPTRGDVVDLQEADVVFYNGLMLEGKMTDVLVRVATRGKPVKAVTERILENSDYVMTERDSELHDPHVWMDAGGWMRAVPVIVETLSRFDPAGAEGYEERGNAYLERLAKLDAYAERTLGSIPEKQRILVTAHDAFNYMGRAYDIEVRGIQGLSTESEAGVRDIEQLIDLLVERAIPAVFVETSVSDQNVEALVEGARARGHEVTIGGSLFSDAMGEPGTYRGTYIGMIDHNVTTIARALGGDAPEGGMQGKL